MYLHVFSISLYKKKHNNKHCTLAQIPGFCPTTLFQPFLANFDAQYGKLGVFGVEEFIFGKKYRAALCNRTRIDQLNPKISTFENNL